MSNWIEVKKKIFSHLEKERYTSLEFNGKTQKFIIKFSKGVHYSFHPDKLKELNL